MMADLHKNKYRIPSSRYPNWDYRSNAAYFITICTYNREYYFGEIINDKMQLSNVGVIADLLWYEIKHHTKNIELGEYIVMPNHIHGILILHNTAVETLHATSVQTLHDDEQTLHDDEQTLHDDEQTLRDDEQTLHDDEQTLRDDEQTLRDDEQTLRATSLRRNNQMAKISPKSNSVSTIIRSYKSAVTKHCNRLNYNFRWQTRFHDHIIRNDKSFFNISEYIHNNPRKWKDDKFNKNQ